MRFAKNGKSNGSEDVELAAVLVAGAEGLEVLGGHTEHKVIGEDRVVVLEDRGDLALSLAFEIQTDRLKVDDLGLGEEIVQRLNAEKPSESPDSHSRAVLLALIGIAGDVRGGDVNHL